MKNVAVFTGTRAEYGLLFWLMRGLQADPAFNLQVIVSGMHLSHEFGYTVTAIEDDGFVIDKRVEMLLSSSSAVGMAKSLGIGVIALADALTDLSPDCIVILGDRFEALAAAQVAMALQIPIAHIHGGELTEGLIDEAIRHSITKMAQLHFASTEAYRRRIIQMGENPSTVFNVGAPAVENLRRLNLLEQADLEQSLGFELGDGPLLVTYHPVTLKSDGGWSALQNLLEALSKFVNSRKIIITYPNADTYGRNIIEALQIFAEKNASSVLLTKSLGHLRYLSLMNISAAVIGNSSSGLIEAPALGVPTIDIGIRQQGRIKPDSVITSAESEREIYQAIYQALSLNGAKSGAASNPYGDGYVSEKILHHLKMKNLKDLIVKEFFDLELDLT